MFGLNCGCILLNIFFFASLTKMLSRASRESGSTKCIHYIALGFNIVAILLLFGMIVSIFFPTQLEVYRYLQDIYFAT